MMSDLYDYKLNLGANTKTPAYPIPYHNKLVVGKYTLERKMAAK